MNPYGVTRWILSPVRLPVPPLSHALFYAVLGEVSIVLLLEFSRFVSRAQDLHALRGASLRLFVTSLWGRLTCSKCRAHRWEAVKECPPMESPQQTSRTTVSPSAPGAGQGRSIHRCPFCPPSQRPPRFRGQISFVLAPKPRLLIRAVGRPGLATALCIPIRLMPTGANGLGKPA